MTEGHTESGIDPFALSDEDYQKEREKLLSDDSTIEAQAGDTKEDASSEEGGDNAEKVEEKKEVKPFTLEDPEPAKTEPEDAKVEETFEIIHRGQVHKVTKEKLVELAQKGFDYDFKVGPHGKLVQLIDSDRGAADVLNDYIRTKYGNAPAEKPKPQLKPMSEFDDERTWFEENAKILEQSRPKPAPVQTRPDPVSVIQAAIQSYDPINSRELIPVLAEEALHLSIRDSRMIEEAAAQGDLRPFFKFYDHVKEKRGVAKQEVKPPPKPSFKMKSGGGEPPRTSEKQINAWELPQKDFQAMLAKVKGGYS